MKNCLKCKKPLPQRSGAGRPSLYCGAACRRTAELEIRRINNQLARLEDSARSARMWLGSGRAAKYEREIRRLEARLAELVATQDDDAGVCIDSE